MKIIAKITTPLGVVTIAKGKEQYFLILGEKIIKFSSSPKEIVLHLKEMRSEKAVA